MAKESGDGSALLPSDGRRSLCLQYQEVEMTQKTDVHLDEGEGEGEDRRGEGWGWVVD